MILILLYTGLRIGELLNLRRQDINRRSSYLIVRRAKTKAGEGRIIPLHHRITPLIEQLYTNTDDYLFNISYTAYLSLAENTAFVELLSDTELAKYLGVSEPDQ